MESKLSASRFDASPEHQQPTTRLSRDGITVMHTSTPRLVQSVSNTISTPSMKAMIPLAMDDIFQHSSSTESAHDQQQHEHFSKCPETPRRSKPSKIPLPGSITKTPVNVLSKPPSGRATSAGPPSNRSFTKSTSSLFNKTSGPSSIGKRDPMGSLTRPDSAQSLRNSIDGSKQRSSGSSIPVSSQKLSATASAAYGNTTVVNIPPSSPNKYVMSTSSSSPLPRVKRDSLQTRVKHLDSLSRLQSTSSSSGASMLRPNHNNNSNNNLNIANVVTNGTNNNVCNNSRKFTALPVRRTSNVSVRDANLVDHHHTSNHHHHNHSDTTNSSDANGGKVRNIRSSIWNWLKI
jgi:hypothetical protein